MDKRQPADNNKAYYYHFDGLGSVVDLSNSNGDSCQSYEYSAYGQVAASDPNFLTNPYMFTGRRFDIETGLYYYRARYYNPHIGRFMQTDPVGYADGINWYLYCGNNPLGMVDPSGRAAKRRSSTIPSDWELFSWITAWPYPLWERPNWRILVGWYFVSGTMPLVYTGAEATDFLLNDRDISPQMKDLIENEFVPNNFPGYEPGTYGTYSIQEKVSVAFNRPYSWNETGLTRYFISRGKIWVTGEATVEDNTITLKANYTFVDWMDLHPEGKGKMYIPDKIGIVAEGIWNYLIARRGGTPAEPYALGIITGTITTTITLDDEGNVVSIEGWPWSEWSEQ